MSELVVRPFETADQDAVIKLWRRCDLATPSNDSQRDIALKLRAQPELFFVGVIDDRVVATVMAGYDGHRGWINYLGVDPDAQRRGVGRRMMRHAEAALRERGCPKINLQVRASNDAVVRFYERLGYTVEARVSMGKRIDRES